MAEMERDRDLVLAPNEYAFILDSTKGIVNSVVGSYKLSLSNSDKIVTFDERTKRFVECSAQDGIKPFTTIPKGWYGVIKNPAKDNSHPRVGTSNPPVELQVGKKINVCGEANFGLYPGQMAKVIPGHKLNCNEYLVVRVYDASAIGTEDYETGELLIIKGTDTPFYIPATGFEVVPDENGNYVRQAVTLELIQYCIKKKQNGLKSYIKGPDVVFPEADEEFVKNPDDGSYIFKAIELSDISGIYVKVVADYHDYDYESDEDGNLINVEQTTLHKAGEELFITGKDQLIYYPREEHSIITYENKVLHHAIAIPAGEGRYVLNRLTGDIKMVRGPKMYLPDPRFEVIVHRKLTKKQCELWYPENKEVLEYNVPTEWKYDTSPQSISSSNYIATISNCCLDALDNEFYGNDNAVIEDGGFNRSNTYSKPRTITIDNRFDGVVTIDVWTGYAINVVSKNGKRKLIVGPQTYLLEYDEVLETVNQGDGETVFLKHSNQTIRSRVSAQTKDHVDMNFDIRYNVDFAEPMQDKWFTIKEYIDYLTNCEASEIRKAISQYNLEEVYSNGEEIIKNALITEIDNDKKSAVKKYFENGMYVSDVEVLSAKIEDDKISEKLLSKQANVVEMAINYSADSKIIEITKEIAKLRQTQKDLEYENTLAEIHNKNNLEAERINGEKALREMREASDKAALEAKKNLQPIKDAILKAKLAREKAADDQLLAYTKEQDKLSIDKQKAHTEAIKKVIDSISPDLVAAISTSSHDDMLKEVAKSIAPYNIAGAGESVSDVVNKLVRGTKLEGLLDVAIKEEK